jgi:hypothetical protein
MCLTSKTDQLAKLQAIAIVLGGFAGARVIGYSIDGVDDNADFRFHQHAVFCSEVLGSSVALILMQLLTPAKAKSN